MDDNTLDDNTLDNAGAEGRHLADALCDKVTQTIDEFPDSTPEQRLAIARICANNIYAWIEENER